MTHSSATYCPTLVQYTQSTLLSIIAGYIRETHFFPHTPAPGVNVSITPPTHRRELHRPILPYNVPVAVARRSKRILENKMWIKRVGRAQMQHGNLDCRESWLPIYILRGYTTISCFPLLFFFEP